MINQKREIRKQEIIGASVSEPHTSESNWNFHIFSGIRRSVNASSHSFNAKQCARRSTRADKISKRTRGHTTYKKIPQGSILQSSTIEFYLKNCFATCIEHGHTEHF